MFDDPRVREDPDQDLQAFSGQRHQCLCQANRREKQSEVVKLLAAERPRIFGLLRYRSIVGKRPRSVRYADQPPRPEPIAQSRAQYSSATDQRAAFPDRRIATLRSEHSHPVFRARWQARSRPLAAVPRRCQPTGFLSLPSNRPRGIRSNVSREPGECEIRRTRSFACRQPPQCPTQKSISRKLRTSSWMKQAGKMRNVAEGGYLKMAVVELTIASMASSFSLPLVKT